MYITPKAVEPTNIYGGCVAEYENIWSNDKVNYWIETAEKESNDPNSDVVFNRALVIGDDGHSLVQNENRTNSNIFITESAHKNEEMRLLHNTFLDTVDSALKGYTNKFGIHEQMFYNEGFNMLRYQGGEHYGAHYDGTTGSGRSVSPILYLNDDYTGGEIEFVNFNLKIKPKRGTLYIFPSNYAYRHVAHPVKTGTKYAIVTWIHDRPFN